MGSWIHPGRKYVGHIRMYLLARTLHERRGITPKAMFDDTEIGKYMCFCESKWILKAKHGTDIHTYIYTYIHT